MQMVTIPVRWDPNIKNEGNNGYTKYLIMKVFLHFNENFKKK